MKTSETTPLCQSNKAKTMPHFWENFEDQGQHQGLERYTDEDTYYVPHLTCFFPLKEEESYSCCFKFILPY